jgi:hypothetical protein
VVEAAAEDFDTSIPGWMRQPRVYLGKVIVPPCIRFATYLGDVILFQTCRPPAALAAGMVECPI